MSKKSVMCVMMLVCLLAGCAQQTVTLKNRERTWKFDVTVADKPVEWERGLMEQDKMRDDTGMLFVFPDEQIRFFWMKNTTIPLSIFFFDKEGHYVHRVDADPCRSEPCEVFSSLRSTQYVLEINQNVVTHRTDLELDIDGAS